MLSWTDSHNHLQDGRLGDLVPVIAALRTAGVTRCVVNATRESDWAAVAALARDNPDLVAAAYGIHPWHADTATAGWTERLADLVRSDPRASFGECGLDGCVTAPAMAEQLETLRAHLRLARELRRPLSIHCVKAWAPLIDALEEVAPGVPLLMHGFAGSIEIARRLVLLDASFSFSGAILHPRQAARLEVLRQLPPDRILLESDAPDMRPPDAQIVHPLPAPLNHPANLPAIGAAIAAQLAMTPAAFANLTRTNAARLFGWPINETMDSGTFF